MQHIVYYYGTIWQVSEKNSLLQNNTSTLHLARIIHECCRGLACPFACNECFANRPYAWLRHSWQSIRCKQSFGAIITAIHE